MINEVEAEIEALVQKIYPETDPNYRTTCILRDLLNGKKVSNLRFDKIYPSMIRKLSSLHWTPVEVAQRAASLLVTQKGDKVLDVGSGCGKFCLVAAASTPEALFYGIEQRSYLNEVAKISTRNLKLENVTFINGNMVALDWSEFDSFYFFKTALLQWC